MLIEFSGLDCAGKSTQIELVKEYLKGKGYNVNVIWSRGGYTPGIEALKNIARGGKSRKPEEQTVEERNAKMAREPQGGKMLLWLSIADLVCYWGCRFRKLSKGRNVILCDRYFSDTEIDFDLKYKNIDYHKWLVWKLLKKVYRKPDCSFVLTVTPEESVRRSSLKFEPFPESEEKRITRMNHYLEFIKAGRWQHEIDCMRPIDVIQKEIRTIIDENI